MKLIYEKAFRRVLLSAFIVLFSLVSFSATYYVSNTGNDSNSGLSTSLAWKTISKVNGQSFSPGDQILFQRGGTWRERLDIPSSGNSSQRIMLSNYGTGVKPRILGSAQAISWTNQGGNIWKCSIVIPVSENVFTINSDLTVNTGVKKSSLSALTADNHWYREASAIYLYSSSNPATRYVSVEVPSRLSGISTNGRQWIEINGIDVFFTDCCIYQSTSPSTQDLQGLIVRNCELAYSGLPNGDGIGIYATYSNSLFENNVIHDQGRRGISFISNTPSTQFTIHDIVVQNNTFYNGYHTTSVDLQTSNGIEGHYDNIIIRGNLIYENANYTAPAYPMLMFLSDQSNVEASSVTNVKVYNNIFKYAPGPAIQFEKVESAFVYNNTFYGHSEVTTSYSEFIFTYGSTLKVKNNIFYSQLATDVNTRGYVYVIGSGADISKIESDYNIYYRSSKALKIIRNASPSTNYSSNDSTAIRTNYGWETHSKFMDPNVKSASDLTLQAGSKAINAGVNVGLTTDFNGNPIVGLPDIGAYESGSINEVY